MKSSSTLLSLSLVATVVMGSALADVSRGPAGPARPQEITIHDTPAGPVFADTNGLTLYVFEHDTELGVSNCIDACAEAWPPVIASDEAAPFDDWSLVDRPDGSRQWAFRSKPLYRYAQELKPGYALGDGGGSWNLALSSWKFLKRATGRAQSGPPPEPSLPLPPVPSGLMGQKTELGAVVADSQGMTLYIFDEKTASNEPNCDGSCAEKWRPLIAPMAAVSFSDWTIVIREDGIRQWALQGKPVYGCSLDTEPGDINCDTGGAGPWSAFKL